MPRQRPRNRDGSRGQQGPANCGSTYTMVEIELINGERFVVETVVTDCGDLTDMRVMPVETGHRGSYSSPRYTQQERPTQWAHEQIPDRDYAYYDDYAYYNDYNHYTNYGDSHSRSIYEYTNNRESLPRNFYEDSDHRDSHSRPTYDEYTDFGDNLPRSFYENREPQGVMPQETADRGSYSSPQFAQQEPPTQPVPEETSLLDNVQIFNGISLPQAFEYKEPEGPAWLKRYNDMVTKGSNSNSNSNNNNNNNSNNNNNNDDDDDPWAIGQSGSRRQGREQEWGGGGGGGSDRQQESRNSFWGRHERGQDSGSGSGGSWSTGRSFMDSNSAWEDQHNNGPTISSED